MSEKIAEFGAFGDAFPGEEPQAINNQGDSNWQDLHEVEYKFIYGNGQLHISPRHEFEDIASHADIKDDHRGPTAVGYVTVEGERATWAVSGNVSKRSIFKVIKEYTKNVGWSWGGMTDIEGEPINDDFAPKKSSFYYTANADGEVKIASKVASIKDASFIGYVEVRGSTGYYYGPLAEGILEWAKDQNIKIAEYPGGGNMNDKIKVHSPMGETLEMYDMSSDNAPIQQNTTLTQKGEYECSHCAKTFDSWDEIVEHQKLEDTGMLKEEPVQDGHFPEMDMDAVIPPHFHERQPTVMPLASWKQAARVSEFNLYADLWGYNNDDHNHYGAFVDGKPSGYASVKDIGDSEGEIVMVHSSVPGRGVGQIIIKALQVHYKTIVTGAVSNQGRNLLMKTGFAPISDGKYKWAAGQQPKDMLDASIPFVYDVQEDNLAIGHPGQRTSDIPGKFTPGGIIEGEYTPGGKLVIHTVTNYPWTARHIFDIWYWSPTTRHIEITGIEIQDAEGKSTKLATGDWNLS